MTVTLAQLTAYAGALALLSATPGPVVAALIARSATGGVRAALPLAIGVGIGDLFWPLLAILGLGVIAGIWADLLSVLRLFGGALLVWMGVAMMRDAGNAAIRAGGLATGAAGAWAGFAAGLAAILGNPKAILFYLGALPGFFDIGTVTALDITLICAVSILVPFIGNLLWAALFASARARLAEPATMRRVHIAAGLALVAVGIAVALG